MIYFLSDTHIGHANIIKYCKRPYDSLEAMDSYIGSLWNSKVKPSDTVYHLGDLAFHNFELVERLNGHIKLVPGNHDLERFRRLPANLEILPELSYLKVDKEHRFTLCHYPIESWRREYQYHLHGHSHGNSKKVYNRLDVGVDATGLMAPQSLDEVMKRMEHHNWQVNENPYVEAKWVSIKDALPADQVKVVLKFDAFEIVARMLDGEFCQLNLDTDRYEHLESGMVKYATHWMRLPEGD